MEELKAEEKELIKDDGEDQPKDDEVKDTVEEPTAKRAKRSCDLSEKPSTSKIHTLKKLEVNKTIFDGKFIDNFTSNWNSYNGYEEQGNIQLLTKPFRLCILENFLTDCENMTNKLVKEMYEIEWTRKQMDLYEFYQSADLSNLTSGYLREFLNTLQVEILPLMEKLCDVKLTHISASCSLYGYGDFLLVHDDLLNDRQVAFVYYLSPWDNVKNWSDDMGGCLELFETDKSCLPKFPIVKKIHPRNNQFVFFKVCSKSFHQVGEVTTLNYPRLTINGWFHGEINKDILHENMKYSEVEFKSHINEPSDILNKWISENYIEKNIAKEIQIHIEKHSEINLANFLKEEMYKKLVEEMLTNESLEWNIKGPANIQYYEVLNLDSVSSSVSELLRGFIALLQSKSLLCLMQDFTELDLYHENENTKCSIEIQRWKQGCYTILNDGSGDETSSLDVILHLNVTPTVGRISFVATDIDEITSNISGKDNLIDLKIRKECKINTLNAASTKEEHGGESSSSSSNILKNTVKKDVSEDIESDYSEEEIDSDEDEVMGTYSPYEEEGGSELLTIDPFDNSLSVVYQSVGTAKFTKYVPRKTLMPKGPTFIISLCFKEL